MKIAVAEITTKAQVMNERISALETLIQQMHGQAHEVGMQAAEQEHQQSLAQQQAQQAQESQAADQSHDQNMAVTTASLQPKTPPQGHLQ